MNPSTHYIGLMSGTSLDGVDAALVDFQAGTPQLQETYYLPYPADLVAALLAIHDSGPDELHRAALLSQQLAICYANAVQGLLAKAQLPASAIKAIGNHGQTIRHRPEYGYTLQLGNHALLAERVGIDVIADFRSRDIAAGGQGAPLVPAFHHAVFSLPGETRAVLNIGGIANISLLMADGEIRGFDTGPGNLLMNAWIHQHRQQPYDAGGHWAQQGKVIEPMLADMLTDPYFKAPIPKSTGRDLFNLAWLARFQPDHHAAVDVQATLLALTCHSIADSLRAHAPDCHHLYVCGGGAHNTALMASLQHALPHLTVLITDQLGIGVDWMEAIAFAWLAYRFDHGLPGNLPSVTGADGLRRLGVLYPA
ncbi:anhydro-N-acetylmuramic acid kinase [Chitinivorax tropicus]|uniref:Anhydro-N-acetylmuramic acid kinase n=1 Tax=Chitinivorax tropicus TaxID=714531 RepID=A0A840MIT0_9PROT|nr:anhydro-N-acetylmuramic acid kinase [Chitinivorax tropicus]MBB5018558.1 anhydro-N-acetylmuramic acid kinase [Chitinivorax tropicus]